MRGLRLNRRLKRSIPSVGRFGSGWPRSREVPPNRRMSRIGYRGVGRRARGARHFLGLSEFILAFAHVRWYLSNIPNESHRLKTSQQVVGNVNFPPIKALPSRSCVVVVVV